MKKNYIVMWYPNKCAVCSNEAEIIGTVKNLLNEGVELDNIWFYEAGEPKTIQLTIDISDR